MQDTVVTRDERIANISITEERLEVRLVDERVITIPLTWYPKLLYATPEQQHNWQICNHGYSIYWADVDMTLHMQDVLWSSLNQHLDNCNGYTSSSWQPSLPPEEILELLIHMYDGLSEDEVAEIEQIIFHRRTFSGHRIEV